MAMLPRWILSFSALLLCLPALFAQTAGRVGRLLPTGFVTHESATAEAKLAAPVFWNDFLRTNEQGRMRVDLEDGSLLTVGAKSELRVVKHDAASQQSSIDLLYGKVRATVAPVTKPGGSFQVRTPTAVIGVIGSGVLVEATMAATATTISSKDLESLPLSQIPVDRTVVWALEHVATVRNSDPAVAGTLYLLPGESAVVERGRPPVRQPGSAQPDQGTIPSAEPCAEFVNLSRGVDDSKLSYKVAGRGTSTGQVFQVKVWNKSPCTQMVFVPAGAVLKPKGYTERLIAGILGGGGMPPLKDFQVMMAEGATQDAAPAPTVPGGMYFTEPRSEMEFTLRGFCLELHKLAPHQKTEYKFDEGKEEKLAPNLKVMESAARLYHTGQARPARHSLDAMTQWALWASREKMDAKKFREEYVGLGKKNYEIMKKKWDKNVQREAEALADDLWPNVEKVLAESGGAPK
jgi:hypothetical protein